jgi:hypothetical protein
MPKSTSPVVPQFELGGRGAPCLAMRAAGIEKKKKKKKHHLHRDASEESPGLHQTEKQEHEGACEKPPSTAN